MRQNYIKGSTFPRIKVQVTVALSSIVASNLVSYVVSIIAVGKLRLQKFDEYHLRRSLRTLVTYADSDSLNEVEGTDFPDQVSMTCDECGMGSCDLPQVRDLAANLHRILLDTVKMKESHDVCWYNASSNKTFCVLTGSSRADGSHVQNIKGVSMY